MIGQEGAVPEETRWPGLGYAPIEEIDELFANWKALPADARGALSAWVALGTPFAKPLVTERSHRAKILWQAAESLDDAFAQDFLRGYLRSKADVLAMPLDLRVDVMRSRGAEPILKFGWREPRKGDLSQRDAMIVMGTELLIDCGVPTTGTAETRSVFDIIAQAMDLFLPSTKLQPRDPASIVRASNRALRRWPHHAFKGRTKELLLNFRQYPPGELGAFVSLRRWKEWTPQGGITWHGVEREASRKAKKLSSTSPT